MVEIRKAFPRRGIESSIAWRKPGAQASGIRLHFRAIWVGKSTLLSIIQCSTFDLWRGIGSGVGSLTTLATREKARLRNREFGLVLQKFNLVSSLTVAENVALPLMYRGMRSHRV